MPTLPVTVGAAMPANQLETYRDWLVESQRDVEIQDPIRPDVLDGEWMSIAQHVKRTLANHRGRIGIHGPFEGLPIMSFDPKVQQLVASRLLQGLDFAEEIGATHMVVHSPWVTLGHPFVPVSPNYPFENMLGRAKATLDPVLARAEGIKCALVIENIFDLHTEPWLRLIQAFNSDFVRASVDIGHAFCMQRCGGAPPDAFVRAAGPWLAHLHIQDTDGLSDRHWAPGDGEINFVALFEAVAALQQTPRMILELHDYGCIPAGAAHLAQLGLVK